MAAPLSRCSDSVRNLGVSRRAGEALEARPCRQRLTLIGYGEDD
jgi:hypothetical protein